MPFLLVSRVCTSVGSKVMFVEPNSKVNLELGETYIKFNILPSKLFFKGDKRYCVVIESRD